MGYRFAGCVVVLFSLFLVSSMPPTKANTDQFTDSIVIIMGKCNTVSSPALWLFGFKFLFNRHIYIQASGEQDEKLTALILPSKIGFYFGGDKSWLFQNAPQRIFAVCKATNILVTYV